MTALCYVDDAGARHEIIVRRAGGDWEVLDMCAGKERVIETLDGRLDGRPQAEAVAYDYLTPGRFRAWPGRPWAVAIPEQGGADAHSHRPPRPDARRSRLERAALPHPAG